MIRWRQHKGKKPFLPQILNLGPQLGQPVKEGAHGTMIGLTIPVEASGAIRQHGQTRHEPHDGSGKPAVHPGPTGEATISWWKDLQTRRVVRIDPAIHPESLQGPDHQVRIP